MYCQILLLRSCQLSSFRSIRTVLNFKSFHTISSKHLLRSSVPFLTHERTFWESFPYFRPLYHEKDGLMRDQYQLIYRSRLFNYVFYAHLGSLILFSSETFAVLKHLYKLFSVPEVVETVNYVGPFVANTASLPSIIAIILFNLQAVVMLVTAQTAVMRVYTCEETEKFVFVKLGLNPFKSRLLHCNPGELHLLEENPLNVFFGNHKLNNEKMFLRSELFASSHFYNTLLSKEFK